METYANNYASLNNVLLELPNNIKTLAETIDKINTLKTFFDTCTITIPDFKSEYDRLTEILHLRLENNTLIILEKEAEKLNKTLVSKTYIKSLQDDIKELETLISTKFKESLVTTETRLRLEYTSEFKLAVLRLENKNDKSLLVIENKEKEIARLEKLVLNQENIIN